jgi:uncharacterized protein
MDGQGFDPGEVRPPAGVVIRPAPGKGRGVFATRPFAPGATVEACPVIVLSEAERARVEQTRLRFYVYQWGPEGREAVVALGYSFLYNHSYAPNAGYRRHPDRGILEYFALRAIPPGEEITVNYNGEPTSRAPVEFEVVE